MESNNAVFKFKHLLKNFIVYKTWLRKTFSQAGQDLWVANYVFAKKRNGYFLEIGSADGIWLNNTYLLEKKYGWNGICIEANKNWLPSLTRNRKAKIENRCIGSDYGVTTFIDDALLGGMQDFLNENTNRSVGSNEILNAREVEVVPILEVLKSNNSPYIIDYLSIDVEGAEELILTSFPFDDYRVLSMTVERPSKKLITMLRENNLHLVQIVPGLDGFFVHQTILAEYANNLLTYPGANWDPFKGLQGIE